MNVTLFHRFFTYFFSSSFSFFFFECEEREKKREEEKGKAVFIQYCQKECSLYTPPRTLTIYLLMSSEMLFLQRSHIKKHGSGKIFCLFLSFFENLGRKKKKIKIFRIFVFFFQDLSRSLRSLKNPEKKRKKREKKMKKILKIFFFSKKR